MDRGRGILSGRMTQDDVERLQDLHQKRNESVQNAIAQLSETQLRNLLTQAAEQKPDMVFDLLEARNAPVPAVTPPPPPVPSWCKCTRCQAMPTDLESLCCEQDADNCISCLPEMKFYVLDPTGIQMSNLLRADMFAASAPGDNESMRHGASRLFVLWQDGHLGDEDGPRRVIPSCCVWRIRRKYPNFHNQYAAIFPHRLA